MEYRLLYLTPHPDTGRTWDRERNEPAVGGRHVEDCRDLPGALKAHREWSPICPRIWGDGRLVIVNARGEAIVGLKPERVPAGEGVMN